jgi:diguanylate cyclase (GGDEF)-like protein
LATIPVDAAEIQRLIVSFLSSAQRELENLKPCLQTYFKLDAHADESERRTREMNLSLERRTREMDLLNELGDLLLSCRGSREAYDVIQQQAQEIFPAKVGALYISTPKDGITVLKREAVWGECLLATPEFGPEDCWAWRRNRIYSVRDAASGVLCKHVRYSPPNGYLCVPLMAQGKTLGFLHLVHIESNHATDKCEQLAKFMGEHIALALANLMKQEALIIQANHDYLTGLYNRPFMEESLEIGVKEAARKNRRLGVIWFDVDYFKKFNTDFGHDGGDAVLKEVAGLLKSSIRGHDIACRYGGDEFVLFLSEVEGVKIVERAHRLRQDIADLQVLHHGRAPGQVTVSVGVAIFPSHGASGSELLKAAEVASKRSKDEGRNRVSVAQPWPDSVW